MNFLAPLGFLFAAALPVIVGLYLLKIRRPRHIVPSVVLWSRLVEDAQANAPFQRLRRSLLLLLQLLLAALVVFALARPALRSGVLTTRSTVVMLDASASMQTREPGGSTRLELAKALALEQVRALQPTQQMLVLSFASRMAVVAPFTNDKTQLKRAIEQIEPTATETKVEDALALAVSLAAPQQAAILLLSDGGFLASPGLARIASAAELRYLPIGSSQANYAITGLDVRHPRENPKENQIFVNMIRTADGAGSGGTAMAAGAAKPRLEIRQEGRLLEAREVDLPTSTPVSQIIEARGMKPGVVEVRLVAAADPLELDNVAYANLRPPARRRVILVGAGNYFIERAMRTDKSERYELVTLSLAEWEKVAPPPGSITVFDGAAPARGSALPAGSYIFWNSVPPLPGFEETAAEEFPQLYDRMPEHPLLRYVEWGNVHLQKSRGLRLPPSSQVVLRTQRNPLISAHAIGGVNAVVLNFDLFASDLPLRVAFPILLFNTLDFLAKDTEAAEAAVQRTGRVLEVLAPRDSRGVQVTLPQAKAGVALKRDPAGRFLLDNTNQVGEYRLSGASDRAMGLSLLNEQESDLQVASSLNVPVLRAASPSSAGGAGGLALGSVEVWRWLAMAALVFLAAEWVVYQRRLAA